MPIPFYRHLNIQDWSTVAPLITRQSQNLDLAFGHLESIPLYYFDLIMKMSQIVYLVIRNTITIIIIILIVQESVIVIIIIKGITERKQCNTNDLIIVNIISTERGFKKLKVTG